MTEKLPTRFGNVEVEYLGRAELTKLYRRTGQRINVLVLRPMLTDSMTLVINITEYWYSYNKNSNTYEMEGGCAISFRQNSNGNEFEIKKVDLWGV